MKVKQLRRWRKRTISEQQTIAYRISGWSTWILLFFLGIILGCTCLLTKQTMDFSGHTLTTPVRESADTALAQQTPGRDLLLRIRTNWTISTGGARVGDVYLDEDRLLECPEELDTEQLTKTASILGQLYLDYQIPMCVIAVPSAGEFYASEMLGDTLFPSQLADIDAFYQEIPSPIRKIDVYHVLFTATDDYIYNRTDPHWTCYGAYCVYRSAIRKMGFAPISYDQYMVTHADTYRGVLYQECLYEKVTPDILDIYTCESGSTITAMTAYSGDGDTEERVMYDMDALTKDDPYTFYLGETCEKLVMQTDVDNQKKLLLLKDSYADCMVPFLMQHYSEICILDVTQMEHPLEELADLSAYNQILVLCDADTYADSTMFSQLLSTS